MSVAVVSGKIEKLVNAKPRLPRFNRNTPGSQVAFGDIRH
jgi:hypothetical protein